jgi:RNA binding exosome subunit
MSQNLRVTGPVRRLDFRVFQHATEDGERVSGALRFVSGAGTYRCSRAEGYHGNPITIIETELSSRRDIELFWERLLRAGLFSGLEQNLEERINDSGELFIRFDKQRAVEGALELSAGDDVIAARSRVFGTVNGREVRVGREGAIAVMRAFLTGGG